MGLGGNLRVVAEEHEGRWYLSPTRTLLESILDNVRDLTRDDIDRMAAFFDGEWWVLEPDSFWDACGVGRPAVGADTDEAEEAYGSCWEHLPDDYEGRTFGYDPTYDDEDYEDDPSWACYDLEDREDTAACLQDLADSGEIDASEVAEYRCQGVYDEIYATDDEVADEQWEEADDRFDACVDADGEVPPSTPTTTPAGSATTVPSTPSTSVPSAPTTTVPSTTAPSVPTTTRPATGS